MQQPHPVGRPSHQPQAQLLLPSGPHTTAQPPTRVCEGADQPGSEEPQPCPHQSSRSVLMTRDNPHNMHGRVSMPHSPSIFNFQGSKIWGHCPSQTRVRPVLMLNFHSQICNLEGASFVKSDGLSPAAALALAKWPWASILTSLNLNVLPPRFVVKVRPSR